MIYKKIKVSLERRLINELKFKVFNENYSKIYKCLSLLNEEQIWKSPNEKIPPIGNQILHLCGNITQWIGHGLGNELDNRKKEDELKKQFNIRKSELIFLLQHVKIKIEELLNEIELIDLYSKKNIQNIETDGISILLYVLEHFSFHTGQITLLTSLFIDKKIK